MGMKTLSEKIESPNVLDGRVLTVPNVKEDINGYIKELKETIIKQHKFEGNKDYECRCQAYLRKIDELAIKHFGEELVEAQEK